MLPLSKTMRSSDLSELAHELEVVDHILRLLNGGDKAQHPFRRWEYGMALKAYLDWNVEKKLSRISDHGCCTGMLSPMMLWLVNDILMYEVWAWGNQEALAIQQMATVGAVATPGGTYRLIHKALGAGQMTAEDKDCDASYCISTLEHIPNWEESFQDLCRTVGKDGMLFLTTDFADRGGYGFVADSVRPNGMFYIEHYHRMVEIGKEEGFEVFGGEPDWDWDESCKLVADYGFASLCLGRAK